MCGSIKRLKKLILGFHAFLAKHFGTAHTSKGERGFVGSIATEITVAPGKTFDTAGVQL